MPPRPLQRLPSRRPLLGALACIVLLGCGDSGQEPTPQPASIQLSQSALTLVQGATATLTASVLDQQGQPMSGVTVTWSATDSSVAAVDRDGRVTGRRPGPTRVAASAGRASASADVVVQPLNESAAVTRMVTALEHYIPAALRQLQELLPRNPQLASYIQAKIALLQQPALRGEIVHDRRWAEGGVASSDGRTIPIVAIFPLETLRAEATQSVRSIEAGLPVLEAFMRTPFPASEIGVWQGFIMGNSGGGGALYMEDRATYEARTPATRLPYEAILHHEVAHSYVGNESLTQFLELYVYNALRGGSSDATTWTFTRGWIPARDANDGVHALLDIYQLIGRDAMSRAYQAVHPLRPPYGQPLSAQARQAFVDQAPDAVKAQVAAKVARVQT